MKGGGGRRYRRGPMLQKSSPEEFIKAARTRLRGIWGSAKSWVARGALCAGVLSLSAPGTSAAEDLAIPAAVAAKLSGSVAAYDRTLVRRAGSKVVIAIITNSSDPDSVRAGSLLQAAFGAVDTISGLPHEEFVLPYKGGPALVEACIQRKAAIVFVSTGLNNAIEPMVKALETLGVLTIAGSLPYVQDGIVLGFDLVSGRPKVVINLPRARKQGLEFRAELLRLARVIQ